MSGYYVFDDTIAIRYVICPELASLIYYTTTKIQKKNYRQQLKTETT